MNICIWTARMPNQFMLKEISPECSLERLMLKLKLQYFGHLIRRADSLEKILMLGKIESERRGGQRMRWLNGITDSMKMSLVKSKSWWWIGRPGVLQSMGLRRVWHDWATELNWTELSFFMVQLSHPYMATGKYRELAIQTFGGKVMSLLFNMLSRLA